jgi:biotin carboxyl carrier protein
LPRSYNSQMKFQAETPGGKHEIQIRKEDGKVFASVDDREYELEVSEPEPGVYLFKHEGRILEASVSRGSAGDPTRVRLGSNEIEVKLIDPKRLRGAGADAEHADGLVEIKTAMPGKVVSVLLAAGNTVEKGDGVLVVEAMKMQNELKSPKAGVIKEVRVTEGAAVSAGDILATIE